MRRRRRVKIVATLGPSSATREVIAQLYHAGADVFRINMSHADHDGMRERIRTIRAIEAECGRPISILVDLQGPKLRIGRFVDGPVTVATGDTFTFDGDATPGTVERVELPHPDIMAALQPGHTILVDDGKVRFRIRTVEKQRLITHVEVGGTLSNKKGFNLPDTIVPVAAMTPKDRSDLDAALDEGVDWIAVSFVQRPDDVAEVRKVARGRANVLAKIEKPQAMDCLDAIIEQSDALMVARGDLGVEMPLEKVPGLQKQITRTSRRMGKPVVVATQMLESMIAAPVPTRAEVSDVATAVFDGADAVMLSAESAAGRFPVEAVATMDRICAEVERDPLYPGIIANQRWRPEMTGADAIAAAAREVSETLQLETICAWTFSGATALRVARERPQPFVLALTPNIETARRLGIAYGVHAVVCDDTHDLDDMADRACRLAAEAGLAQPGQRIIVVAGIPFGTPGATNMMRIAYVK